MTVRFSVLTPDAQYADDGILEREVAGAACDFEIHRERDARTLPPGSLSACDALLCWHEVRVDAALIARLDRCRVIVRGGVGFDHIDIEAAGAAGIPVCNTPDYGTSEVADHAIALMLALVRGITTYQTALRRDLAGSYGVAAPLMRRIRGATLGVVGLGRIGTATALRAKAFGMRIVAFDPHLPAGQEIAIGADRVGRLADLLGQSDVVSIHTPLTPATRHLFDDRAFAAMKPGAILINTARGAIVDLDALHRALEGNRLAGAGLDVLPVEPPTPVPSLLAAWHRSEPWIADRLLLTPHAAWNSPESRADARRKSAETVLLYLRDGYLRNCVNDALLDGRR